MIISKSITKKYTPPTCTLEVVAKKSLLSRWSKQPLLNDMSFQLRFDDPRKPQEEQVTLTGNQLQLEMLCEVVNSYVQDFLGQSPLNSPNILVPNLNSSPSSNPENLDPQTEVEKGDAEDNPPKGESSEQHPPNLVALPSQPFLQGQNCLVHQLFFGNLATEVSGSKVNLSALQLFDLATALDEYSEEMAVLPTIESSTPQASPLNWASVAAVALLTVGLTTALLRLTNQTSIVAESSSDIEDLATASGEGKSDSMASIALPESAENFPIPTPTLPTSLAKEGRLPPPPRITTPPPNLPSRSNNGTSKSVVIPRSSSSTVTQITTSEVSPPPPSSIPASPVLSGSKSLPPPAAIISSSPLENTTQARPYKSPEEPKQLQSNITPIPTVTPKIPHNLPSLNPNQRGVGGGNPNLIAVSPQSTSSAESQKNSEVTVTPSTAITPVAQAQSYFQERWQPPEDLDQALEYRLILNSSGSIERIIPLGKVSRNLIDRTPMPVLGEAFVTGFTGEEAPQIRVVFKPDGSVQTYGE